MVCYARPAIRLAALLIVALLVFGRTVSHLLDTAAFLVVVTVAIGGAAIAAALVFAAFLSTRHRRAAAGGCVSCQFRCQHAMTGPPRRLWLVSHADRTPAAEPPGQSAPPHAWPWLPDAQSAPPHARPAPPRAQSAAVPGRAAPVLLPMPAVRSADPAPRWPDQPLHRSGPSRERAGSPA